MRHLKKCASLILALVMALALAVPAFAAQNTTGSITINQPADAQVDGAVYHAYRIFDLESYDGNNYSYVLSEKWKDFLGYEGVSAYVKKNDNGYIEWINPDKESDDNYSAPAAAVNEFARLAKKFAEENNIQPDGTSAPAANGKAIIENLSLGYYLVDSTVGTVCSLNTTDPDAVINDKNEKPTVDKEVQEDNWREENEGWGDTNDADIGQRVDFHTTINAYAGAENYVLHDVMDPVLAFNGVTSIVRNREGAVQYTLTADDYEVVTPGTETAEGEECCTFEVVFKQSFLDTLEDGDQIVVSYNATLTAEAEVNTGYENETRLEYGNKHFTHWDKTKTYTWGFNLHKYANDIKDVQLAGAKFELRTDAGDENTALRFDVSEDGYTYTYTENGGTKDIMTVENHDIIFEGLDSGIYYLVETEAPEGYNLLTGYITVEIKADETGEGDTAKLTATVKDDTGAVLENGVVNVQNQSGVRLPSTGGIGTTIFYVVGGMLAAGAVILLITKRRMNIEK